MEENVLKLYVHVQGFDSVFKSLCVGRCVCVSKKLICNRENFNALNTLERVCKPHGSSSHQARIMVCC